MSIYIFFIKIKIVFKASTNDVVFSMIFHKRFSEHFQEKLNLSLKTAKSKIIDAKFGYKYISNKIIVANENKSINTKDSFRQTIISYHIQMSRIGIMQFN